MHGRTLGLTQQVGGGWRGSGSEHRVSQLQPGPGLSQSGLPLGTLMQRVSKLESHLQIIHSEPLVTQRPRKD